MYYKLWSEDPSHIWDYIAFNQLADGSIVTYEMKDEFAIDYVIYKSDKPIEESTFEFRGLSHSLLSEQDLSNYVDNGLKG